MTYKPNDAVKYHEELADDWEARYKKRSFQARMEALEECLRGRDLEGKIWLDAGCGTGTLTRFLARRGCAVTGLDAAPQMIAVAREQARNHPAGAAMSFAVAETIEDLPVASGSLDGVLCSSVLEYVGDPGRCLSGFARVLKPGGMLLISVPNSQSIVRRAQVLLHRLGERVGRDWLNFIQYSRHQYSAPEFDALLRHRGFETQKMTVFGSPMPRWVQRQRVGGSLLMFMAVRK